MRQFLLGKNVEYPTAGTDLSTIKDGAVGFFYFDNGVLTLDSDGSKLAKEGMLVLGRPSDKGGPVVLPIFKNKFSYVKGIYSASTTFKATVTVPTATRIGSYSIIIAKKGVKFNERNKWTAEVYISDPDAQSATLVTKLVDAINNNAGHGCTATDVDGDIVIEANEKGIDYAVLGADNLFGAVVTENAKGTPAYGDAKYVQDLADKAAADAGFEYTYRGAEFYMYPNYPLDVLAGTEVADNGYTIFTLNFAEPRDVRTVDQVINQIIQVAFPTGAAQITTFEGICEALVGGTV